MHKKFVWCLALIGLLLPAALLVSATALAKGVPIGDATDEQRTAAKAPYIEGRKAFDEGRHQAALEQFKASYDIVASPNSHHMMAMAMRELGMFAQAYEHFGEVAAEADAASSVDKKYAKAADNARAKRQEMMDQVGFVNLDITNPDGARTITIGDRPIERSRWSGPVPANPGPNTIVLTLSSGESITKDVTVVAGGSLDVALTTVVAAEIIPETEEPEGDGIQWFTTYRLTAYAVAGAGLISFGIAGGLGSAAQSKHDELASTCGLNPCPQLEDDISSGESLQVATNVMIVFGVVLVAGGGALWFFAPDANGLGGDGGDEESDDDASDFGMYVAPLPGGVMLGGQF